MGGRGGSSLVSRFLDPQVLNFLPPKASSVLSLGSVPDLLRLLAVPVLGWAAWRDVETRRVPNRTWVPLLALGIVALVAEAWDVFAGGTGRPVSERLYLLRIAVSLGFVAPLAYGFWWIGGFGGADAKAFITLAVLFPTFPTYYLPTTALPLVVPTLGVFSMTVLSNTVLLGLAYPVVLTVRNAAAGRVSKAMVLGRPVRVEEISEVHGRLLQTPEGFTRNGLDLDAVRMYLAWRGTTLAELRADPGRYRDPASIPADTNSPGDGAVTAIDGGDDAQMTPEKRTRLRERDTEVDSGPRSDSDGTVDVGDDSDIADPWGAEQFLADIEGSAYGTTPEKLRGGLNVLTSAEEVWITPGIPFLVPMFVGLIAGLTYGDVLFVAITATGLV